MNDKDETIGVIVDMLQGMSMRKVELVWRIVRGMSDKEVSEHG